MLKKTIAAFIVMVLSMNIQAAVNVSFLSSAPPSLQDEFMANATNQYVGTITKSPFFANTYSLVISGKNPGYQPPAVSSPILTSTAFQECMAYGFGDGMDEERRQNIGLVWGLHSQDVTKKTCAGQILPGATVSTTTCAGFCQNVYGVVVSTISERNGDVFDSHGNKVN